MGSRLGASFAGLVAVLAVSGCTVAGSTACRCPKPIEYNDATIKAITAALRALPPDNVLHAAMDDYEDERYNLRQCAGSR